MDSHVPEELASALSGRYRIERLLGAGGMATVYLAHDVKHDRQVAIKLLRPEVGVAFGAARFLAEVRMLAHLQHPHIVGLIDSGTFEAADGSAERAYYVMPFVEGEGLRDRISRSGPLPIGEVLTILAEVADALSYAHQTGLVHRDIKPDNVLLSRGHAMVADFGVAKALGVTGDGTQTTAGLALGTPAYMAPEQLLGDPHIDHRVDLYALGVMAYELTTGSTPFAAAAPSAVVGGHLGLAPPPILARRADCPPALAALIERLLAKAPEARPPNAEAVRDELRAIASTGSTGTRTAPSRTGRRRVALGIVVATVLAVAAATIARAILSGASASTREATGPRSIAVLPFVNIGGDSSSEYFGDGIAEEIINALGRLPGLRVASRTSSFAVSARQQPGTTVGTLGRRLGVGAVLEGSVRRAGTRVRVSARLVEVSSDSTLWTNEYQSELRDVFQVQDTIAREIVSALRPAFLQPSIGPLIAGHTTNPEAHDRYLRGRYFLGRRTPAAMALAIENFNAALALDSTYTLAYAGLADGYALLPPFGSARPRESLPKARAAAERALALDSTVAEAHISLGIVSFFYDWDLPAAERHLTRGIQLNPSFPEGHLFYAWYLFLKGRRSEAIAEVEKAGALDPLSVIIAVRRGSLLHYLGRDAEAVPFFRQALEIDSTFYIAKVGLAASLVATGQREEARRQALTATAITSGNLEIGLPVWILAQLGDTSAARARLREIDERAKHAYVAADGLSLAHLALGETDAALDLLEQAAEDRAFTLILVSAYPYFAKLHGEPRYQAVMKRLGMG